MEGSGEVETPKSDSCSVPGGSVGPGAGGGREPGGRLEELRVGADEAADRSDGSAPGSVTPRGGGGGGGQSDVSAGVEVTWRRVALSCPVRLWVPPDPPALPVSGYSP